MQLCDPILIDVFCDKTKNSSYNKHIKIVDLSHIIDSVKNSIWSNE